MFDPSDEIGDDESLDASSSPSPPFSVRTRPTSSLGVGSLVMGLYEL